ncbi:MAG: hypothetical protein WC222_02480 [Parachlamydiales bacterium]
MPNLNPQADKPIGVYSLRLSDLSMIQHYPLLEPVTMMAWFTAIAIAHSICV